MNYYHATYRPLISSIEEKGLGGALSRYIWDISKAPFVDHLVYLSDDRYVAASYAEANDEVPEEWLDQIVVFRIPEECLDEAALLSDENISDSESECFEYNGIIPFEYLEEV